MLDVSLTKSELSRPRHPDVTPCCEERHPTDSTPSLTSELAFWPTALASSHMRPKAASRSPGGNAGTLELSPSEHLQARSASSATRLIKAPSLLLLTSTDGCPSSYPAAANLPSPSGTDWGPGDCCDWLLPPPFSATLPPS